MWNGRKTHWICVFLLVLVLIMIMTVLAETFLMIHSALHTPPQNTTAVVLGCSVKGTKPSRILEERIDAAYDYLSVNKDAVCILSGGRGPGEDITEAQCMYEVLTKRGISENRLILEERSTTTEENLKYTGEILSGESDGSQAGNEKLQYPGTYIFCIFSHLLCEGTVWHFIL